VGRLLHSLSTAFLVFVAVVVLCVSTSMPTAAHLLLNHPHALVIGGTGTPVPPPEYVNGQTDNYIGAEFPGEYRYAVHTPQNFWPVYGSMSFDESTVAGLAALQAEMAKEGHFGSPLVILGYSSSTRILTADKNRRIADGDYAVDINYVLVSDVAKGNGGVMARFPGWHIPILGVTFDGATRTDSDGYAFDTKSISFVHDGWSDFPVYPLNVLALANAVAGIAVLHPTYPELDRPDLVPVGSTGDTEYFVIGTDIMPLLMPLETIGVPRPILLAVDEPLRVLVEAGYRRDIAPGAPTPARLIPIVNPITLTRNFIAAIPVGVDDAMEELGHGRPLGTQPSGVFGVGGEDTELKGLPAGVISLAKPTLPVSSHTTVVEKTERKDLAKPAAEPEPVVEDEPAVEDETPVADTKKASPKPLRPKVRGPISFDAPKLPTIRKATGDRPLKRLLSALTPKRPKPASSHDAGPAAGNKDTDNADKPAARADDAA